MLSKKAFLKRRVLYYRYFYMKQLSFAPVHQAIILRLIIFIVVISMVKLLFFAHQHHELKNSDVDELPFEPKNIKIKHWQLNTNSSNRRIFFHETSGRSYLTFRQCCSVESATKHNPTRPIQVFLSSPNVDVKAYPCFKALDGYPNVEIILIEDDQTYFEDTVFEDWYKKGEWRTSKYKVVHVSDFMRLISLQRNGGLYLDLDYMIMRSLDENFFKNFLLIEGVGGELLNNGVMHLESGHWFIEKLMEFLVNDAYDPEDYALHGPSALSYIYRKYCEPQQNARRKACSDLKLLSYHHFCPVGLPFWFVLFENATEYSTSMIKESHGVHLWNSMSKNEPVLLGSNQLYALLAAEHCPLSIANHQLFMHHFGNKF